VTSPRSSYPRSTRWAMVRRKLTFSLITVTAAAGVMGLATFGSYDNSTDTMTRSMPAAGTAR
jgi:hypothetical protein